MAGSRMYYSNVLTTTRGEVDVALKVQLVSGATPSLTLLAGHGINANAAGLVSGVTFSTVGAAGGTNNAFTITWPEKFGKCVNLDIEVVSAGTDAAYGKVAVDYNATSASSTFAVGFSAGSTQASFTAAANGTYVVYLYGTFELGM